MKARVTRAPVVFLALSGLLAVFATVASAETEFHGLVLDVQVDKCGDKVGTCQGSVVIGYCEAGTLRVRVKPGSTTIRRGGEDVDLEDLKYGDKVLAELLDPVPAEDVPGYVRDGGIARIIEVR